MSDNPLGRDVPIKTTYDPSLLYGISRSEQRMRNGIKDPFFLGYDIWNAYEVSWLNKKGKPEVRIAKIIYSSDSEYMVESKSFKLYLFSFSMTKFKTEKDVINLIKNDLKKILGTDSVRIFFYPATVKYKFTKINKKILLDQLNVKVDKYEVDPRILKVKKSNNVLIERYSNLLKTNCPITSQPDWATIYINYRGNFRLDDSSLLEYIISYREYRAFHESICERIFKDIYNAIDPRILVVKCFYTRRGGLDINPIRFHGEDPRFYLDNRYWRQ